MSRAVSPSRQLRNLSKAINECLLRDRPWLGRQVKKLARHGRKSQDYDALVNRLEARVAQSRAIVAARQKARLRISFDDRLPVAAARQEIATAIEQNQVLVLCGETGSGKTTQLPKLCLELGRGVFGQIGHTQPRRIAARSVARRIATETGGEAGDVIGYQTRFDKKVGDASRVKVMTDGILLSELRHDRWLNHYDTIIIDEAHERSLNIDFLLGYLHTLLAKRPDLKLIITSATLETDKFSQHFHKAPVLEISGRTWPVDIEYLAARSGEQAELGEQVAGAVATVLAAQGARGRGDILVFLPGERQISECRDLLRKQFSEQLEVLPLFGRLSSHEQDRVFARGKRVRCILATNIAETSLTLPGIRYVVDTGLARISRYSVRNKVQQLPIEKISQASARQRAGRCGRLENGLCLHLFSEEDFLARPEHTDPEILRTSLARVILEMATLKLGDIEKFPFVDKPDGRFVRDGYRLLEELQALDANGKVSRLGHDMARLPVDPRIARMLLAAKEFDALAEVQVVAAALSIPDPRQRPADSREAADEAHAAFTDPASDFVGILNLWLAWRTAQATSTAAALRKWCKTRYLSYPRMREWQDLVHQLHSLTRTPGPDRAPDPERFEALHRALLPGLLGHVARRNEEGSYQGTRGRTIYVFPGSGLRKTKSQWIVAAQLIETTRLFAHNVARVKRTWIEKAAGHLLKREYHEPRWDSASGKVMADETVSLYGLVLATGRAADYGNVNSGRAREIFILEALVAGQLGATTDFLEHNQALVDEIRNIEARLRRHDVLVGAETRAAFYAQQLPQEICDRRGLLRWRRTATAQEISALYFDRDMLMQHSAQAVKQYPDRLQVGENSIELEYHFEHQETNDGVTAIVPLALLNQLTDEQFDFLVPGLLREKLEALIRGLPKRLRRRFVPVPQFVDALLEDLPEESLKLNTWMARKMHSMTGAEITAHDFAMVDLPEYLRMNFRIVDDDGATLAEARLLEQLRDELGAQARTVVTQKAASSSQYENLKTWDFGELPEAISEQRLGTQIMLYPAIRDNGDSVSLVYCDDQEQANQLTAKGLVRLGWLALPQQIKLVRQSVHSQRTALLGWRRYGDEASLVEQIFEHLAIPVLCSTRLPRNQASFAKRLNDLRPDLVPRSTALLESLSNILQLDSAVRSQIDSADESPSLADIRAQVDELLHPAFLRETEPQWLARLPVYLQALKLRLERLPREAAAEKAAMEQLAPLVGRWRTLRATHPDWAMWPHIHEFRWLLEEFRVSLFAQKLRTVRKVSAKRLEKFWQEKIAGPLAEAGFTAGD